MDRRVATHLEKFEKFIRVQATVEAGEESIQFESYVCEVIPPHLPKYFVASEATYRS